MFKQRVITALLPVALLLFGCGPTPTEEPVASAPIVGPFVPTGQPEVRDLAPTTEVVSNCGGGDVTVVKHPSMTVLTSHSVEWEVGGEVGVGVTIGEGVVPGGVDLGAALDTHVKAGAEQGLQQSMAWDLPANPNTIMEYTLMWREVWQPGYIEVRLAGQSVKRINVRYRAGIQSEIVGQRKEICEGGQAVMREPTPTPFVTSVNGSGICRGLGELGPWPPTPDGRGNDVFIDASDGWVHADFWSPTYTLKEGYDQVSVLFEPGTRITVLNVAGVGWKFAPACTREYVEQGIAQHQARRASQYNEKMITISVDELCVIAQCR